MKHSYINRQLCTRVQRAYVQWFKINRQRFAIQPRIVRRRNKGMTFSFEGITPLISASLENEEISVVIEIKGELVNIFFESELNPKRNRNGFFCGCCPREPREYYPSREALRAAHVFEYFLQWVNELLASAEWLYLCDYDDKGIPSTARLLRDDAVPKDSSPVLKGLGGWRIGEAKYWRARDSELDCEANGGTRKVSWIPLRVPAPR